MKPTINWIKDKIHIGTVYKSNQFNNAIDDLNQKISSAKKRIYFVSKDLNNSVYNHELGRAVSNFVNYSLHTNFHLLFYKKKEDNSDIEKNIDFFGEFLDIDRREHNRVHLYQTDNRPKRNFAICDNVLYTEIDHKNRESPKTRIINSEYISNKKIKEFNKMVDPLFFNQVKKIPLRLLLRFAV